jgi:hypothetical protein
MEITTMQCVNSIKAATKGKAPIVAIPVEGHAPACVKRSRLAAWCKGVTIISAEVVQLPATSTFREVKPKGITYWHNPVTRRTEYGDLEGPNERVEDVTPGARYLEIIGRDGTVKTRAKFALIDRRTAVKELAKWTERERAKHEKKVLLGVLSKDEQRALKLAKAGDLGEDMVPVTVKYNGGKESKIAYGAPVTIARLPECSFVVHPLVDADGAACGWSLTECSTGLAAGRGTTAQDAIAEARKRVAGLSDAGLATLRQTIESSRLTPAVAA